MQCEDRLQVARPFRSRRRPELLYDKVHKPRRSADEQVLSLLSFEDCDVPSHGLHDM